MKETITFGEFTHWLNGLILGKRGALPDIEDWKQIKKMLDKVEYEKEYVGVPSIPYQPYIPPSDPYQPGEPYQPWCTMSDGTDIAIKPATFNTVELVTSISDMITANTTGTQNVSQTSQETKT